MASRPGARQVALGDGAWLYSSWAFAHFRATAADAVVIGDHTGVDVGSMFVLGTAARVRVGDWCVLNGPIIATEGRVEIGDHALISYGVVLGGATVVGNPACVVRRPRRRAADPPRRR